LIIYTTQLGTQLESVIDGTRGLSGRAGYVTRIPWLKWGH